MHTFLGISTSLGEKQLDLELIRNSAILYLEGYLFDEADAKRSFHLAVQTAKRAGRKVALSLSDGFCVDRHRAEFLDLIRSGIDILFANESEIKSLYQTESFELAAESAQKRYQTRGSDTQQQGLHNSRVRAAPFQLRRNPFRVSSIRLAQAIFMQQVFYLDIRKE